MTVEGAKKVFQITGADGQPIPIEAGEYYFNTKARCRRMMANSLSAEARRVYAALELATMGFKQEDAVVMEGGRKRKIVPDDLVRQTGMTRQEVRSGLEELEESGLAERYSDDGGPLRKGHVHVRSWAEPQPNRVKDCRGAPLQFPDWWPKPDEKTPRWIDSWAPLRSLITRLKLKVCVDEESARYYKDEGAVVASAYKEAEIVAARFLERVCAPKRPNNKEERTERTSERTEDSSSVPYSESSSSPSRAREEEEEHLPKKQTKPESETVGGGALPVRAREPLISPHPQPTHGFAAFAAAYPAHRWNAAAASIAYRRTIKTPAEHLLLMQGLERHLICERWARDNGQYVPQASKFITEQHYQHDPPPWIEPKRRWTRADSVEHLIIEEEERRRREGVV